LTELLLQTKGRREHRTALASERAGCHLCTVAGAFLFSISMQEIKRMFSKEKWEPEIEIVVNHKWHPDTDFIFTFPKILPKAALDAEKTLLGLTDAERPDKSRLGVIDVVAKMCTRAPQGFDGFPTTEPAQLEQAVREYFDAPHFPELEAIISTAWSGYRAAARPAAYAKSLSRDGAGDDQPPGAAAQT
jgi:hypothetical protein